MNRSFGISAPYIRTIPFDPFLVTFCVTQCQNAQKQKSKNWIAISFVTHEPKKTKTKKRENKVFASSSTSTCFIMSNSTGLHARKKIHQDVEEGPQPPPSSGGMSRYQKAKRGLLFPLRFLRSEVGCAFEAVIGFLVCGLLLAFFMSSHQHRKVVLHVMSNPMAHAGAALKGRVGFRHHFYSGHPRTVTVVLPSVVNPKGRQQRLDSIFQTWGPAARAIYVVHNVSEFPQGHHAIWGGNSTPEDPYSYPQLLLVPPSIGSDDGLPRLNYVIRSVYEKVNPDFAFFVNDHTFGKKIDFYNSEIAFLLVDSHQLTVPVPPFLYTIFR